MVYLKASEIRIGNYLGYYKPLLHDVQYLIVKGIVCETDSGMDEYNIQSSQYSPIGVKGLMPVPITEDLLSEFGFEYGVEEGISSTNGANFLIKEDVKIHSEFLSGAWKLIYKSSEFNFIEIKYVHQLQNLFFAITGQELELKIDSLNTL